MARLTGRSLRILDFDIECRPLSWYGGDWVTKEVTAIAAAWVGDGGKAAGKVHCWLLDPFAQMATYTFDAASPAAIGRAFEKGMRDSTLDMYEGFRKLYEVADIVTGHYIRGFDLPVLNGVALEFGLPTLENKLAHDTKSDLVKATGMSKSMENLGAVFELKHPKVIMDQAKWRAANRLLPRGIALTKERVVGDVLEHIELRQTMLDRGLLKAPAVWSGASTGASPSYQP